jgi:cyclophilin family peptidyl-prolyl cis-trans isomerase
MIIAAVIITVLAVVAGCGTIPQAPGSEPSGGSAPSTTSSAEAAGRSTAASAAECEYTRTGTASRPVKLPPTTGVPMTGTATAVITTSAGKITVTLDRDNAPCTVNSFISLARQGFYDKTPCPRMTDAGSLFMLQCGDPVGDRTGNPGYTFPDELSGDESYDAGTVAMANSDPNTNGSQFFLVYKNSDLAPDYTVFGSFDAAGIAVLTKIAAKGVDNSNGPHDGKPNAGAEILSVTVS